MPVRVPAHLIERAVDSLSERTVVDDQRERARLIGWNVCRDEIDLVACSILECLEPPVQHATAAIRENDLHCRRVDDDLALVRLSFRRGWLRRSRLSGGLRGLCARRRRSICGCGPRRARGCGWRRDCLLRLGRGRDEERLIAVQNGKRQKNCEEEPTFHVLRLGIRDRVHAVAAKRMAPCQTSAPEPHTAPRSM